jgi:hypothetical protein
LIIADLLEVFTGDRETLSRSHLRPARRSVMKRIQTFIYQTPDEIEERIRQREADALQLRPDTDEHRKIMQEIARLRIYADTKRWLAGPSKQHA